MKWNETRWIGAIFAQFRVAQVCQRQLGFLVGSGVISVVDGSWIVMLIVVSRDSCQ